MQKILFLLLSLILSLGSVRATADDAVQFKVLLSPAGSFVGHTNDIKGFVTKEGDFYKAQNIVVNLKNLKTGIDLRDRHTQKHLGTEQFPQATLTLAEGRAGKGKGKIKIRGKEAAINGTYEVKDKQLTAKFTLHLPDFDITGIRYMSVGVKDDVSVEVTVPIQAAANKSASANP